MTAKEWIIESHGMPETEEHANEVEMYAELMNEYALHIAEKAVESEIEYSGDQPFGGSHARSVSKRILSRIKTLTEEKDE